MIRTRTSRLLVCAGLGLLPCLAITAAAPAAQAAPAPKTIDIQVVPQLPNVHLSVNGIQAVTDASGNANITVSNLTGAAHNLVLPDQQLSADTRVRLDRVASDPNHGVSTRKLIAELDEFRAVTITLLTPQRKVLPFTHVSSVTLNDSLGGTTKIGQSPLQHQPVWLASSRPHKATNQVTDRQVSYSVRSVMIRGTNVVNSGQLRFIPNGSLAVSIPVILHALTVDANDLLAGKPAGTAVQLTYPNGTKQTIALGSDHRVTVPDLPRGTYRLKVEGGVIPLASTVHLSRDQTATELVVTNGDFAELVAIVLAVLAILVGAGIIGRRRRRQAGRGRSERDEGVPGETERNERLVDAVSV